MFKNRTELMCIAICGVIFYHMAFHGIPLGRLNIGYAGVDIFMLLSGFGVAHSLSRNSLKQYYIHRTRRILPLWVLTCVICQIIKTGGVSFLRLTSDITTFSFFVNPDSVPEWYLQTLILFYLISPLIKFLIEKSGWLFVSILSVSIIFFCELGSIHHWQYENAIPRFSLFVLGLTCYIKNCQNLSYKITLPLFILGIVYFFRNSHYLFSSLCIPLVIQGLNFFFDKYSIIKSSSVVNWIGRHTLELYVGNLISAELLQKFLLSQGRNPITVIVLDLCITILLSFVLTMVNNIFKNKNRNEKVYSIFS